MLRWTINSENYESLSVSDMRVTVIAADGQVLYDDGHDVSSMANHADREEVAEALSAGIGESKRFSETLGQETYYYAVMLEDGLILRLSKTANSIWGMFGEAIPVVIVVILVMIIVGYFFAVRLTKRIVEPINNVRINNRLTAPYDELAPFVRTITEQRNQIERQISDMKKRSDTVDAIMNSMLEGIIIVDGHGMVLSVNKSASEIFSFQGSPVGKNILEILRDVELNENMRLALSGIRGEMNLSRADKIYRVYFSPVTDSGAIILFLDVTEKSMSEKLRREFSANVSHELKTPLTIIYGNAEMLENGMVKDQDKTRFYNKIKDEAARLIALVEDIMMLSRLDEESVDIVFENVDLASIANGVIESLETKIKELSLNITVSGEGIFSANRSQMVELFYNLIDNAIKYNRPKGSVSVDISVNEKKAKISVADTGIGIPQEEQGRIFERFYRVDKSRSKKTGGTGLGLAIVKHIAMAYNGTVEVKSNEDEGTTITVSLQ